MTSWADDSDHDLGSPPPLPPPAPPLSERRSYSAAILEPSPQILVFAKPTQRQEVVMVRLDPPRTFIRQSWDVTERRAVKVAASCKEVPTKRRNPQPEPKTTTCQNGECKRVGYLNFTDRHVESQLKEIEGRLPVGVYCLPCVDAVAPRCAKTDCTGKSLICPPTAAYAFSLFCTTCMNSHRAGLRTRT